MLFDLKSSYHNELILVFNSDSFESFRSYQPLSRLFSFVT